jgi:hypothetical protein
MRSGWNCATALSKEQDREKLMALIERLTVYLKGKKNVSLGRTRKPLARSSSE